MFGLFLVISFKFKDSSHFFSKVDDDAIGKKLDFLNAFERSL